jgi:NADH-quinone oxidoreductase subunit J
MNFELISFLILALIAIVTAIGMLASRNAVYSALHLIVNFGSVAMLYLILGAPFIALAQVTVYAGAIMVLFLFVIMLLGAERLDESLGDQSQDTAQVRALKWQKPTAIILGAILLGQAMALIIFREHLMPQAPTLVTEFSNPLKLAEELFNSYLLPFEVTSVLLLVAMIGAIVLTRRQTREERLRRLVRTQNAVVQDEGEQELDALVIAGEVSSAEISADEISADEISADDQSGQD